MTCLSCNFTRRQMTNIVTTRHAHSFNLKSTNAKYLAQSKYGNLTNTENPKQKEKGFKFPILSQYYMRFIELRLLCNPCATRLATILLQYYMPQYWHNVCYKSTCRIDSKNRIFEVISPLTICHIPTCQSVAIFTCQFCHNIYSSI